MMRPLREHNTGRGARHTAHRRPVTLSAVWGFSGRRAATLAEIAFKRKNRRAKDRLIASKTGYREGVWKIWA